MSTTDNARKLAHELPCAEQTTHLCDMYDTVHQGKILVFRCLWCSVYRQVRSGFVIHEPDKSMQNTFTKTGSRHSQNFTSVVLSERATVNWTVVCAVLIFVAFCVFA